MKKATIFKWYVMTEEGKRTEGMTETKWTIDQVHSWIRRKHKSQDIKKSYVSVTDSATFERYKNNECIFTPYEYM